MAGDKMTIKVTDVTGTPWNKPGSEQFWYSVACEELGEPVKFVQDRAKGAPAPVAGNSYEGNMYEGNKFYAFGDKPSGYQQAKQTVEDIRNKTPFTAKATKSDAYLKDVSNTPVMIYNGSLNYAKELGLNLISDEADRAAYLNYVKDISDEMLLWIEKIRNDA